MRTPANLPGSARHQSLLRAIISQYENDPRFLAIVVFGSLARGAWDEYSDIDCDIVLADDVQVRPIHEVRSLENAFARVGEKIAFIIPMADDAADVQLCSLLQLSIRYHPLAQTSPTILDDMIVVAGGLDRASIVRAGERNRETAPAGHGESLDVLVRHAVVANACLQRGQPWATIDILHRMRSTLMDVFALTHGGERAYQFFDAKAPPALQAKLKDTLSSTDAASLCRSLLSLIGIIEQDLKAVAGEGLQPTDAHRLVLGAVRTQIAAKAAGA